MAEATKMDAGCTMGLSVTVFVMALLLSGAASLRIQAYFNKTADLPCQFTNSQSRSLSELVVFWQDQERLVLYELFLGREKPDNVDPKYIGRTSFDQESWNLQLHNVQIKDKGVYQCFVHHRGAKGLVPIYQMNSELSVLANFTQPEITLISNITRNSAINLTCSSVQGYPEPKKMFFVLKTENATTEYDGVMQKSQDNVTGLYNISISGSITFSDDIRNATIYCVLQTESTETYSQHFPIVPADPVPVEKPRLWIAAVALTLIVVCGIVLFLTLWKRKKEQQPGVVCECETIKMDKAENEHVEERVKIHEPEKFGKAAKCVHRLKTPSSDKSAAHF
uniref:T-lymphocyte activation antigen CD86 n=1 Tax=Oryctolagus cuniculus TaxID=9986 RepID=G1T1I0_RABIT